MARELIDGVLDAWRGAAYLARHPALLKYVVGPAIAVALLAAVLFGWVVAIVGAIGLVGWASLAIACGTVIATIAMLISGPFNEMLSESIEERETGVKPPAFDAVRFLGEVAVSIAHAIRRGFTHLLFLICLLFVAHFFTRAGEVFAAVASAWIAARFAAYAAYDAVWGRKQWRYRDKTAYLSHNHWRTLGLGAVVAVGFIVPGVNVIGLAIGSAGATLRMLRQPPPGTS